METIKIVLELGLSLAVQWLRLHLPMLVAWVWSLIGRGSGAPEASQPKKQNTKQKRYGNELNKDFKNGQKIFLKNCTEIKIHWRLCGDGWEWRDLVMDETWGMWERRNQGVPWFLSLDGGWWKVLFKAGKGEMFGGREKKGELCFRHTCGDVQWANKKARNLRETWKYPLV